MECKAKDSLLCEYSTFGCNWTFLDKNTKEKHEKEWAENHLLLVNKAFTELKKDHRILQNEKELLSIYSKNNEKNKVEKDDGILSHIFIFGRQKPQNGYVYYLFPYVYDDKGNELRGGNLLHAN